MFVNLLLAQMIYLSVTVSICDLKNLSVSVSLY